MRGGGIALPQLQNVVQWPPVQQTVQTVMRPLMKYVCVTHCAYAAVAVSARAAATRIRFIAVLLPRDCGMKQS
jgi:hypothetical protein